MPLMNKLFTMVSQIIWSERSPTLSRFEKRNSLQIYLWSYTHTQDSMCVCVCVCEQTEGDVLAGSFQTQAASTISQLTIFNSKNEFGSQKQDTQTQTRRHTKTKETPVLVYLGMKLHCCCTLHLAAQSIWENGGQKWDIWRLVQETSGAVKVSSWAFFSSLNPSELHTSTSSYRYWQGCYHVVVLPLTTSTTPDGYQCTFVTCVNSEAPISVSSLLH